MHATQAGRRQLLMIDDDRAQCLMVTTYLQAHGFDVTGVHSGPEGVERATASNCHWDGIILDVMLPGLDGFEVLRQIRKVSDVPLIMLTAHTDETDRIVGLEIGADDYLLKPFSARELLARLRAVLRRSHHRARPQAPPHPPPVAPKTELVAGSLVIKLDSRTAAIGGEPLWLTPVEFDLLASLIRSRGRVKTREALLDEIRERDYDVFDRSIDVHISSLRKKLNDHAKQPRYIRTVRSVGYMLIPQEPA